MGGGRPSYEDLEQRVGELERENAELRALVAPAALIEKLTVELAELRVRVDMSSRNSSTSTSELTLYRLDAKRGTATMDARPPLRRRHPRTLQRPPAA